MRVSTPASSTTIFKLTGRTVRDKPFGTGPAGGVRPSVPTDRQLPRCLWWTMRLSHPNQGPWRPWSRLRSGVGCLFCGGARRSAPMPLPESDVMTPS